METPILTLLAVVAAVTASLAMVLAAAKLAHRQVRRYRGVRTAYYTSAIGELLSRGVLPARPRVGWSEDPLFHEAISDYRLIVTGSDRRFVDTFVESLGINELLVRRVRRRFPQARRLRALSALVNLAGPREIEALRALIADRNPHVRVNAVRGLARLGDVDTIPQVLDILTRVRPWEAARTGEALMGMGFPAVDPVVRWIGNERMKQEPSVEVVALAARLLGLVGDPAAESVLISLLTSPVPDWRLAAASALEHTGGDSATEPLRLALDDDDWRVRARAVLALGAIADPAVMEDLARLLTDDKWWVRQNAAEALARLPGGSERLSAVDATDAFAADAARNQLISGMADHRTSTAGV